MNRPHPGDFEPQAQQVSSLVVLGVAIACGGRPLRGGHKAGGVDAGIYPAARRDVLYQQLYSPACADRVRRWRRRGRPTTTLAAPVARSPRDAARSSLYPTQRHRGGARPNAVLRLEQTDQEPKLTGAEK